MQSPLIKKLIDAFCCLPGVGPKSAQRMAYHLLERNREAALTLSESLSTAITNVHHCNRCRDFTEQDVCGICSSEARDNTLICVVESPVDVYAIEATASFKGKYFVLMGHLSPLDGIGPEDIGLDQLKTLVETEQPDELILAMNATVEGEATAHFVAEMFKNKELRLTRLASGVPIGGELEYLDGGTLMQSLSDRRPYQV
ncbi:MAG: recombination protein RecR [Gammaproteobacteria bacterium]|nr:recombination protein RecR [Gammaproteobacteria bacterium]